MDSRDNLQKEICSKLKSFPDFPKKGVLFKDIGPLLQDPELFQRTIQHMADQVKDLEFTHLVALEARGFLFAPSLSVILKKPVILIRKKGKLPGPTFDHSYTKEYGDDVISIQDGVLNSESKCLLVDDLLATGGTLVASSELIKKAGGIVSGFLLLIELDELKGREKIEAFSQNIFATMHY